jgi:hypothetical protein
MAETTGAIRPVAPTNPQSSSSLSSPVTKRISMARMKKVTNILKAEAIFAKGKQRPYKRVYEASHCMKLKALESFAHNVFAPLDHNIKMAASKAHDSKEHVKEILLESMDLHFFHHSASSATLRSALQVSCSVVH